MYSAPKQRDRSISSQRSSLDISYSRPLPVPSPAAGTKRLFSDRSLQLARSTIYDGSEIPEHSATAQSEKRQRSGNWPLPPSSPPSSTTPRHALRSRNAPNSPAAQRPSPQKRPSKFLEGSMNDKTSRMPDTTYLGLEEDNLMESHAWEQATRSRPQSWVPVSSASTTGNSEVSRHSSIFRFGKTIAATFNPTNWKMFNKQDRAIAEADVETAQHRVLRERQEKAERIYAELKQTGHFPTVRAQNVEMLNEGRVNPKHDSGISVSGDGNVVDPRSSMDSQRSTTKESKRRGRIFLEPPSTISHLDRGVSPSISNFSTPSRRSFSDFKRTSLSNIKKKFSYDGKNESVVEFVGFENSARRVPSRKDLQKQQKLVKKVSNLEGKLADARRQLNETLTEPTAAREPYKRGGRRKFVPGAMPTLPSERLLAGYVSHDEDQEDEEDEQADKIGKTLPHYATIEANGDLDEPRGRCRTVQEPEVSPSHFYPSSPFTKESFLGHDRVSDNWKSKDPKMDLEKETEYVKSEVSVSTKVSKAHSVYVPENESNAEDSIEVSAAESSSVASPSEPYSEGEKATPKNKRQKSSSTTPIKKNPAPSKAQAKATNSSAILRKRKAISDRSGLYRPTAGSSTGESEVQAPKRQTPKRKSVGIPVKKVHKPTGPVHASPPRRLPPPPPIALETDESEPVQLKESIEVKHIEPLSVPPTRAISRKAVSSAASRVSNPKSVLKNHPRARQSASPPPSAATFAPELDLVAPSRLSDNAIPILNPPQEKETTKSVEDSNTQEQDPNSTIRRVHDCSNDVPPMPRLPKTVRLPTGEIVDVKVQAPRASSRSGSRVAARDTSRSSKVTGSIADKGKNALPKSGTRNSFEWPDDCF